MYADSSRRPPRERSHLQLNGEGWEQKWRGVKGGRSGADHILHPVDDR